MNPSAVRVARAWNNDLMLRQVGEFRDHLQRFNTAVQTRDRLVAYRWLDLVRVGKNLADWAVETRSIPKGREKAAELAFRLFLAAARAPRDVFAWAEKNQRHLAVFQEALGWPEKSQAAEGSEETFPLAGFTVHNTLNLSGSELETTKNVVEQAAKTLRSASIPKGAGILYGNLFIVGRLKQANTLAWYNSATDEMYLRPFPRVGRGEIHNLLHELGHRYWHKVLPREQQSKWATYHMLIGIRPPTDVKLPQPGEEFPVPIKGRKTPPIIDKIEGDVISFVGGGSMSRSKTYQILRQQAAYPTDYASTSYSEHFAEAFAMYALGTLKPEHVKAFEAIVVRGEAYDPRAVSAASRVATRFLGS